MGIDKESLDNLNASHKQQVDEERARLKEEMRKDIASKRYSYRSKEHEQDVERRAQEKVDAKIKDYQERLQAQQYQDWGGSPEEAHKLMEQEEQRRKSIEIQQQQTEDRRQEEQASQQQKMQDDLQKQDLEEQDRKKKEKDAQIARATEERQNIAQGKEQERAAKRAAIREQFRQASIEQEKSRDR